MEQNYKKNFIYTLHTFTNKYYTNYYGFNSPSSEKLNLWKKKNIFDIIEFYLFNINGILIINYQKGENISDNDKNNNNLSLIRHTLLTLQKLNQLNHKKNFLTYTIYLFNYKIVYLFQNKQILVGKFKNEVNNYYCHLCLKFIYISLINFKFDINEKLSLLISKIERNNSNCIVIGNQNYKKIDDYFKNQKNVNINENEKKLVSFYNNDMSSKEQNNDSKNSITKSFSFNDYLEIKIYEKYFLKSLINHFNNIFELICFREELFLYNIKLKNVYFVDIEKHEIIFDYNKINNHKLINFKFYKQEKLFKHCLLIAKKLEIEYKSHLRTMNELEYIPMLTNHFGKFECTSTYPRYSFYIKYLPIFSGIAIIHIYSQKKLSRQYEQNSLNTNINFNKKYSLKHINKLNHQNYYYEFITLFSNNNKNEENIKYFEPEKIKHIQKFFFEFFIALTKQNNIFYYLQKNKIAKYFNKNILNAINSVPSSILKEKSLENVFLQINLKLENLFLTKYLNESNNVSKKNNNEKELNNISKIFEMEEDFILLDLFKDLIKKAPNCLIKFDNENNNEIEDNDNKNINDLLSMKNLNSIITPLQNEKNDNNKDNKINIFTNKNNQNNYKRKDFSKNTSLKLNSSDFSSYEFDDSSINMPGISRKVSSIYERNKCKFNRKEFLNNRKESFFEEEIDNEVQEYNKKNKINKLNKLKRVMTFENGNNVIKYSDLKFGGGYDKDIVCKKFELLGFSGSFGRGEERKNF